MVQITPPPQIKNKEGNTLPFLSLTTLLLPISFLHSLRAWHNFYTTEINAEISCCPSALLIRKQQLAEFLIPQVKKTFKSAQSFLPVNGPTYCPPLEKKWKDTTAYLCLGAVVSWVGVFIISKISVLFHVKIWFYLLPHIFLFFAFPRNKKYSLVIYQVLLSL